MIAIKKWVHSKFKMVGNNTKRGRTSVGVPTYQKLEQQPITVGLEVFPTNLLVAFLSANLLKKSFKLLMLIFLCPAFLFAQNDSTGIVTDFTKKNFVQPYIGSFNRTFNFISKEKSGQSYNMKLAPNAALFAGLSFKYKRLSINVEVAIPNSSKVPNSSTEVRAYSKFIHFFQKNWGVSGFVSWNKGLLMKVPFPMMYADRNDLRMITVGAHFYSILNGKKFSYTAANSMSKLQTKSKGSLVIMTTPVFRNLSAKVGIIPDSLRKYHFNGASDAYRSLQFISIQCRPGYIHNFIFKGGKYFFAPAIYAGAGAELHTFKSNVQKHTNLNLSTGYRTKITTGVNSNNYYLSLEYLVDNTTTYLNKTTIKNTYTEISLNVGFRF